MADVAINVTAKQLEDAAIYRPTDLLLTGKLLQLKGANGEAIGEGVKLQQETFELWNDITLEEDASSITMAATDGGAALNIKKLFAIFVGSFAAENPSVSFRYNSQNEIYQMLRAFTLAADTVGGLWIYSEKIAPGVFRSVYPSTVLSVTSVEPITGLSSANADLRGDIYSRPSATTQNYLKASRWTFGPTNANSIRAGSRIMVWGVQDTDN